MTAIRLRFETNVKRPVQTADRDSVKASRLSLKDVDRLPQSGLIQRPLLEIDASLRLSLPSDLERTAVDQQNFLKSLGQLHGQRCEIIKGMKWQVPFPTSTRLGRLQELATKLSRGYRRGITAAAEIEWYSFVCEPNSDS